MGLTNILLNSLLSASLIFSSYSANLVGEMKDKNPNSEKIYQQTLDSLDTPEKIDAYMKKHFHYREDKYRKVFDYLSGNPQTDFMQSAKETFETEMGDCEDYANFAYAALKKHFYKAVIVMFFDESPSGHAVCAFIEDGEISYLSNDGYECGYANMAELATEWYPEWDKIKKVRENSNEDKNYSSILELRRTESGWIQKKVIEKDDFPLEVKEEDE